MCGHSESANKIIEQLLHKLYPDIQHQFVLIDAAGNQYGNTGSRTHELLVALKNEFQSLVTYESKLVFSSVLKVFNSASKDVSHLPNIEDLQQLTLHKEQHILELVSELEQEMKAQPELKNGAVVQLIDLFKKDFAEQKQKWNSMIKNWLIGCACFKRISNQFNKEKV